MKNLVYDPKAAAVRNAASKIKVDKMMARFSQQGYLIGKDEKALAVKFEELAIFIKAQQWPVSFSEEALTSLLASREIALNLLSY